MEKLTDDLVRKGHVLFSGWGPGGARNANFGSFNIAAEMYKLVTDTNTRRNTRCHPPGSLIIVHNLIHNIRLF